MNNNSAELGEMTLAKCQEHFDDIIKQSSASAKKQGVFAIFCLLSSVAAFLIGTSNFGATFLIVAAYFWQEANKAEIQGNFVVAIYPLSLLLNR